MTRSCTLAVSALFIVCSAIPGCAQAAVASPAPASQLKCYLVDYAVDPHPFVFTITPDGAHARVESAAVAYDSDGKRLNYADRSIGLNLTTSVFDQIMHTGVPMHQEIDLPAGRIYLRIVVRNLDSARVGAMEIPLMVVKQL